MSREARAQPQTPVPLLDGRMPSSRDGAPPAFGAGVAGGRGALTPGIRSGSATSRRPFGEASRKSDAALRVGYELAASRSNC